MKAKKLGFFIGCIVVVVAIAGAAIFAWFYAMYKIETWHPSKRATISNVCNAQNVGKPLPNVQCSMGGVTNGQFVCGRATNEVRADLTKQSVEYEWVCAPQPSTNDRSPGSTSVDCAFTSKGIGAVTLSGNVIDNLFDQNRGVPTDICLVGPTVGGWTNNTTNCRSYVPGGIYWFISLNMPQEINQFTFVGKTPTGDRWSNNSVVVRNGLCGWSSTDQLYFSQNTNN